MHVSVDLSRTSFVITRGFQNTTTGIIWDTYIGRDGMELLRDNAVFRVDRLDDRGGEEGETLYGDVV